MADVDMAAIGRRVRRQRLWKSLSLEQLAVACELTKGYLSKVENGKVAPSVGTLARLATALDLPLGDLVGTPAAEGTLFMAAAGATDRLLESDQGYRFLALTAMRPESGMQPFIFEAEAGQPTVTQPLRHPGEEFVYVLEGRLRYSVGSRIYEMGQGDSLVFDSDLPHEMKVLSERARWLAVFVSPPTQRRRQRVDAADLDTLADAAPL